MENREIVLKTYTIYGFDSFGMRLANLCSDSGNDNKYLYNGKELEDDFNLNWYHYEARYYDPQLCIYLQVVSADEFKYSRY